MKRVLVIDGGGLKGFIPLQVLLRIEEATKRPLWETFDLIVGTSVGAIFAGMAASGYVTAVEMEKLMDEATPRMFKRRMWPLLPKYRRKAFVDSWVDTVPDINLGDCPTVLMTTAVNLCDGRTHYFKSDDPKDMPLSLIDAVQYSFAAPLYFGGMVDEERKAVWLDGGTGIDNCPILEAIYEILRRGWLEKPVHMLSLGCGFVRKGIPFKEASRRFGRNAREIRAYLSLRDGGLARTQSIATRVSLIQRLAAKVPTFSAQRLDVPITAHMDRIDCRGSIGAYKSLGIRLGAELDAGALISQ